LKEFPYSRLPRQKQIEITKWEISNQEKMTFFVENLIFTLESNIPRVSENEFIFDRIQQVREQKDLVKQYGIVCTSFH
jgi:hypothetical protein